MSWRYFSDNYPASIFYAIEQVTFSLLKQALPTFQCVVKFKLVNLFWRLSIH